MARLIPEKRTIHSPASELSVDVSGEAMNNRHYVYIHKLNDVIVYIGIGTGDRIRDTYKRQVEHLNVWDILEKVKVAENLSKEDAHKLEQKLLDQYWKSGKLFNKRRNSDKVKTISYAEVSKYFYYDETSPSKLMHLVDKFTGATKAIKKASADSPAGTLNNTGYYLVSIQGSKFLAHRVVYCLISNSDLPADKVVDHVDGNRSNNTISNLRLISPSDNCRNKKHRLTNTGYQSISNSEKKYHFQVSYVLNFKSYSMYFSYTPKSCKNSRNHYSSKEAAFAAALEYRNELVKQGVIILTNEK